MKLLFNNSISKKKYRLIKNRKSKNIFKIRRFYFKKISKRTIKWIYIFFLSYILFLFINNPFDINDKINSFVNHIFNNDIKAGLCVLGKKENLYAKEFVNHYKELGYTHIFIYDNNDSGDERFEEVLQEEIKSNFVSIINIRGIYPLNEIGGPQCLAYKDCYEKNSKNFDWLSFFDFDEFLELPEALNIEKFLRNKRYKKCENIKVNYISYSDNELLNYDNRPVQERFTKPLIGHKSNMIVKSTVRGGLAQNYWSNGCTPHTSFMNITSCNSLGEIINPNAGTLLSINYTFAYLKHYYTKSLEEYVNKTKRGDPYTHTNFDDQLKREKIENYFFYNKNTSEKQTMIDKLFNSN